MAGIGIRTGLDQHIGLVDQAICLQSGNPPFCPDRAVVVLHPATPDHRSGFYLYELVHRSSHLPADRVRITLYTPAENVIFFEYLNS